MGERQAAGQRRSRVGWLLGLLLLFVYMAWILGPYFRSVIVRDAAVTTWINVATSPIYGHVDPHLPAVGQVVGRDGIILGVVNERADRSRADEAVAEVERATVNLKSLNDRLALLRRLDQERLGLVDRYAEAFVSNLDVEIEGAKQELVHIAERIESARALAERKVQLAKRGSTSQSEADQSLASLSELEFLQAEKQKLIAQDEMRKSAAGRGTFLASDGTDPGWGERSRDTVQVEIASTAAEVTDAEASLAKARIGAAAALQQYEDLRKGQVTAPPGSILWSLIVGAGAAVDVGEPVVEWLDCQVLLLDVPVSDVEAALLRKGMLAEVVIEGENQVRQGTVSLTRGSAATLDRTDLAAVAKGRKQGVAQAILRLDYTPAAPDSCPVGQAAHVEFPEIGIVDIVRARLRL